MDRRIAGPAGYDDVFDALTEDQQRYGFPIFESRQKVLMFASAVGRLLGGPKPVTKRALNPIRAEIFESNMDAAFIGAMAVVRAGDLKVLSEGEFGGQIELFEGCAELGLSEIRRRLESGDQLDAMLALVEELRERPMEESGASISRELLKDLGG